MHSSQSFANNVACVDHLLLSCPQRVSRTSTTRQSINSLASVASMQLWPASYSTQPINLLITMKEMGRHITLRASDHLPTVRSDIGPQLSGFITAERRRLQERDWDGKKEDGGKSTDRVLNKGTGIRSRQVYSLVDHL